MKFIDLFAGLGAFHSAFHELGLECVFASEIDDTLRDLYKENYGLYPEGDIRKISEENIPNHDILCAGFPCQPFSLAGKKKGAKCPSEGKLIDDVIRIAKFHKPSFLFLENVPNILTIDDGKFWIYINSSLKKIGYIVDYKIYSPVEFGIPQKRKRVFIIAKLNTKKDIEFKWPKPVQKETTLRSYLKVHLAKKPLLSRPLEDNKKNVLKAWQSVVNIVDELSHHVMVASEFGATYPLENLNRFTLKEIRKYKGAWGESLEDCDTWKQVFDRLPHYINKETKSPSDWILSSLLNSRSLFKKHQIELEGLTQKFKLYPQSWQKMQWQGSRETNKKIIADHLIQFRASGIRIIKPQYAPSLVAMTSTQIPILGDKMRYMNDREAAALQGLQDIKVLPKTTSATFKALGNAVNANLVKLIGERVILKELIST